MPPLTPNWGQARCWKHNQAPNQDGHWSVEAALPRTNTGHPLGDIAQYRSQVPEKVINVEACWYRFHVIESQAYRSLLLIARSSQASAETQQEHPDDLEKMLDQVKPRQIWIIAGDFNAEVEVRDDTAQIFGPRGPANKTGEDSKWFSSVLISGWSWPILERHRTAGWGSRTKTGPLHSLFSYVETKGSAGKEHRETCVLLRAIRLRKQSHGVGVSNKLKQGTNRALVRFSKTSLELQVSQRGSPLRPQTLKSGKRYKKRKAVRRQGMMDSR